MEAVERTEVERTDPINLKGSIEWKEGRRRNGGGTRGRRREEIKEGRKDGEKWREPEENRKWRKWKERGNRLGEKLVWRMQQSNRSIQWHLHSSFCHGEVWKAEERSKQAWDISSLLEFDDNTFHDKNDALTMHQSTVLWFECVQRGKQKRMGTRIIEKGPVEAKIRLTFAMVRMATTLFRKVRKSEEEKKLAASL